MMRWGGSEIDEIHFALVTRCTCMSLYCSMLLIQGTVDVRYGTMLSFAVLTAGTCSRLVKTHGLLYACCSAS